MRILHIVSNISLRSGIMSVLMSYYRHIDRQSLKFDFLFYEKREPNYENEILKLKGRVFYSPKPTQMRKFNAFINGFCAEHSEEYDIIELHDPFLFFFYRNMKKKLKCKIFISHAHSTRMSDSLLGELRNRLLLKFNIKRPDVLFACSAVAGVKTFGKKFARYGIVINNAIDLKKFNNNEQKRNRFRKELRIEGKFVVGHVGNFTEPKNHAFILEVFSRVLSEQPNSELFLIGSGDRIKAVQDRCKALDIYDKVIFAGVRNDICNILCAFDVFLFPSLYEGFGIALIEAQAVGLPCVYSDVIPKEVNVITENNRILSLKQKYQDWVKAILDKRLEINYKTKEKIEKRGFSIESEAVKLVELYEKISKKV